MKKCLLTLLLMGAVCISQAAVIGDFENGSYDGWTKNNWEDNTTSVWALGQVPGTVTLNQSSLAVKPNGGYWEVMYNSGPLANPVTALKFDLTMIASEWTGAAADQWTQVADKIHIQGGGITTLETNAATAIDRVTGLATGKDWGNWGGTQGNAYKTFTLDLSSYDLTGTDWFQINISIQSPGLTGGNFYFDNIQLVPEPATLSMLGLGALAFLRKRK